MSRKRIVCLCQIHLQKQNKNVEYILSIFFYLYFLNSQKYVYFGRSMLVNLAFSYSAETLLELYICLSYSAEKPPDFGLKCSSKLLIFYQHQQILLRFRIRQLSVHYFIFILHQKVIAFRGALNFFPIIVSSSSGTNFCCLHVDSNVSNLFSKD